ncbi:MAG: RIP metalloprotease RseP [Candidatus Doudnabacteria bacterium]|nr:RIP metalloprotease RseP [Candidatus Doudnabacteria bacterium]
MIILTIIIFILILGLLVFVHELGHFVMAKRAGMEVEEFGFGFPPRLFGFKKGGTVYSLNWIPLGGFVKIVGEDGSDSDNPRSFGNKRFGSRFMVLVAGVTMNFILAWVLISLGLGLGLPTVIGDPAELSDSAKVREVHVSVVEIASDSPADQAGLRVGDSVLAINGEEIDTLEETAILAKNNAGLETLYTIKRGGEEFDRTLIPREDHPEDEGPIGVTVSTVARVAYPWYETLPRGLVATFNLLLSILSAFGVIISRLFAGQGVGADLAGPVGIAVLTRDVAQLGFIYLVQFTAVLSVNLAIINAIPFPALDGGRILFLIIEKVRGKKMRAKIEQVANTVGFVLLLLLMVLVTVKDFGRFDIIERVKNLFI